MLEPDYGYQRPPTCGLYDQELIMRERTPMRFPFKFRHVLFVVIFAPVAIAAASLAFAYQASLIPASRQVNPDDLVKILQSAKSQKPLMIQVGSHVLYTQAHIPGSDTLVRLPVRVACSCCASGSSLFRETSSSLFIADAVPGAIVRTSSLPTMRYTRWDSPM